LDIVDGHFVTNICEFAMAATFYQHLLFFSNCDIQFHNMKFVSQSSNFIELIGGEKKAENMFLKPALLDLGQ
jgi:hypothetical protein